jgi:hypothetical protein
VSRKKSPARQAKKRPAARKSAPAPRPAPARRAPVRRAPAPAPMRAPRDESPIEEHPELFLPLDEQDLPS